MTRELTGRRYDGLIHKADDGYTDSKDLRHNCGLHFFGALDGQLPHTVKATYGQWLSIYVQVFSGRVRYARGENITTIEYSPLTNGQAERFSSTLVSRMRHYVSEHQTNWDTYLFPLM